METTKADLVEKLLRYNPFGGYSTKQPRDVLERTLANYRRVSKKGREAPEAGAMSKGDGLGGPPPAKGQGEVFAETDPEHWPDGRPTFGQGR